MRELKFRVFNGYRIIEKFHRIQFYSNGNWAVMQMENGFEVKAYCSYYKNNKAKLLQYTGLKDINNEEIYEGHVIEIDNESFIVEWNNNLCRFCLRLPQKRIKWVRNITSLDKCKILGNIYENPEFIKRSKKCLNLN